MPDGRAIVRHSIRGENSHMTDYRTDPAAIRALVEPERVHRDVYVDATLFEVERERLFGHAWLYVGHTSQVPGAGDFAAADLAGEPVLMVRDAAGAVRVLRNRCAHKGAMLTCERSGNAGRAIRCPYHAWAFRLDGSLLAVPEPRGFEGTSMRAQETGRGLGVLPSAEYRGFVFARLADVGPAFEAHCGALFEAIDALVDRSPEGRVEVVGQPLRNVIACNWKIYLENINDAMHANVAHESAALAAEQVWSGVPPGTRKPMAVEILMPFGSGPEFLARMGGQVFAGGHSVFGSNVSIHSDYSSLADYEASMHAAYGEARAKRILAWVPQNSIAYPSVAFKSAPSTLRVLRPLAVDRTLVEVWAFRPVGAPDTLLERTLLYNRMVFSPMSMVAHDDIHIFESIQRTLRSGGNPWVSLHRDYDPAEAGAARLDTSGINEALMRNQFRAWVDYLAGARASK